MAKRGRFLNRLVLGDAVVWPKLKPIRQGAIIASQRLWSKKVA
jgi:hypothetical protein